MTVQEIYNLVDTLAPFDTQDEFDNSGLLVGSRAQEVTGILLAMDTTEDVIREALEKGANLIITHHPLMFTARKRMTDEDFEGRLIRRLIREDLSLIAAHTCLDKAPGGINDTLAALCGLTDVEGEDYIRVGNLPSPVSADTLARELSARLGDTVRRMGPADAVVHRLGLCSGSGSGEWEKAALLGCDAFLSGEVKHHHALDMADNGIVALEGGHYATEVAGIFALGDALQNAIDKIELKKRVFKSSRKAYSFPPQP